MPKPKNPNITQSQARTFFYYNPDSGELTWRIKPAKKIMVGSVAGSRRHNGYCVVQLNGDRVLAHRLIWLYWYGYWPTEIDHIDGDPSNNRIQNIRECSHRQNTRNTKKPSSNTSGVKGVSLYKRTGLWRATLGYCGETSHIGYYKTIQEAEAAARVARETFHGEYARHA